MNFLKLLFNPIFLLAAGLHAGLLLIPIAGGSSDELVPAPDPEGESITVTRIPPRQTATAEQPAAPRPATAATVPTARPATVAATSAPRQQVRPGTQATPERQAGSQPPRSSDRTANQQNTQRSNRAQTGSNRNSSNEISVLPAGSNATDSRATPSSSTATSSTTPQPAPTLTALKTGAQSQSIPEALQTFFTRLRQLYNHSVLNTTDQELAAAQQQWLTTLQTETGLNLPATQELEKSLEISYPLMVDYEDGPRQLQSCLNPLPQASMIGVVVDQTGAIAVEPTVLSSSGYDFLNAAAIDVIKAYDDFPQTGTEQAYTIKVDVDYDSDACVKLADLKQ